MRNVIVFTGDNTYLLMENVRFWKAEFIRKHGEQNCTVLQSAHVRLADLRDEAAALPFLAEKRLLILHGIPRFSKEEMRALLESLHENTILLFLEPSPDKRLGGVQELLKVATIKRCTPLHASALWKWAQVFLQKRGRNIQPDAWTTLLEYTGNDQAHIASELEKLSLFASDTIQKEDVIALAVPAADEKLIWDLVDLLQKRNPLACTHHIERLLLKGEDVHHIWNILLWIVRSLVTVTFEKNLPRSSLRMRPNTARALKMLSSHTEANISHIVRFALSTDRSLKNGELRTENTRTIELECCSVLLLHMLSSPATYNLVPTI